MQDFTKKLSCMCAAFGAQSPRSCHLTPVIMADRYGMDSSFNPDLLCVELCRHGITCKRRKAGSCGYAHALQELRPPNESRRGYGGVWKDGVDRFYGQRMTETQIERVMWYYERTCESERPMWSHALRWYIKGEDLYSDLQADFGIDQDWNTVSMFRKHKALPFSWAPRFWERISKRSQMLQDDTRQRARVSRRVRTPPKSPPVERPATKQCSPSYADRVPQEETYAAGSEARAEGVSPASLHPERMRQRRIVSSPPRRPHAKIRKLSVHGIDQPQLPQEGSPGDKYGGWLGSAWAPVTPRREDVVWRDEGDRAEEKPMDSPFMYVFGDGAWIPTTPKPLPCMTPCPESSLPGLTAKAKPVSASVRPPIPKALFPPLPSELTFAPAEIAD